MEKKLPFTALAIETILVSLSIFILVKGSTDLLSIILPSVVVVFLLGLLLSKSRGLLFVGYAASLAFTLYFEGRYSDFAIVRLFLIVLIAAEIFFYFSSHIAEATEKVVHPVLMNATVCFLGFVFGALIRPYICPEFASATVLGRLLGYMSPICMTINRNIAINSFLIQIFLSVPAIGFYLSSFTEAMRTNGFGISTIFWWFINLMKGLLVSGVIIGAVSYLMMVYTLSSIRSGIAPDILSMPISQAETSSQVVLLFSFVIVGFMLLMATVFGWAVTLGNRR